MVIQLEQLTKALLAVPLHEYKIPPEMYSTSVYFKLSFCLLLPFIIQNMLLAENSLLVSIFHLMYG